jgi:hypothetical protein
MTTRRDFIGAAVSVPLLAAPTALAVPVATRAAPALGEGKAIMMINGESLLLDLTASEIDPRERAVVINSLYELAVTEVANIPDGHCYWMGRRTGHIAPVQHPSLTDYNRHMCIIIGRVIELPQV